MHAYKNTDMNPLGGPYQFNNTTDTVAATVPTRAITATTSMMETLWTNNHTPMNTSTLPLTYFLQLGGKLDLSGKPHL